MSALEQGGAFHHTSSSLSRRFSAVQNNSPRLRLHTNTSLFTPEPSPVLSPNTPRRAAPFVPKRRVKPKHLAGASLVLLALALFFLTSLSPPPALAPSWPLAGFFSDRSHAEDIQNSFPDSVEEPHRDTLVLYRILGNDLPPRHAANQTLQNLDFLLRNELPFLNATDLSQTAQSPFRRIDKYFILNRITAAKTVAAIRRLLLDYGVDEDHMLEIPFEWEEYEQRSFRWDGGVADASDVWGLPVTSDLGAARYLSLELSNKTLLQGGSYFDIITSSLTFSSHG